jgi:catechol 2,3-dioxygenase-like lactoylglutathione lyase family enzyme
VTLRFINPIAFVRDIAVSRAFYRDVLGLTVAEDHGTIVIFKEHFAIHEGRDLGATVWGEGAADAVSYGLRNVLFYFEDDDIDACFARIGDRVDLIHPIVRQTWGQRVFRFHDPDGHAVEVGEPIAAKA